MCTQRRDEPVVDDKLSPGLMGKGCAPRVRGEGLRDLFGGRDIRGVEVLISRFGVLLSRPGHTTRSGLRNHGYGVSNNL